MNKLALCLILTCVITDCFGQRPCNLFCDANEGGEPQVSLSKGNTGSAGKRGPRGNPGVKGDRGNICGCDCSIVERLHEKLESMIDTRSRVQNLPTSCAQIRNSTDNATENGVYYIRDSNNISFPVYCDMNAGGGGWTLVASVHENNIRSSGRCSVGDKWSNEHGNEQNSQVGAEAWFNYETFGNVVSATSEDYKNPAYFDLQARDVMIWQVPNNTPLQRFQSDAYLKYRTRNRFLSQYGGNMFHLYKDYYPIKSGVYTRITDNGPAIPVVFDKGSAAEVRRHFGSGIQPRVDPGYIQFRAINHERSAYALCPGTRGRSNHGDLEHTCIGSTADNDQTNYCGDFAAFSWDGYGTGLGSNTDLILLETTFLIFYR